MDGTELVAMLWRGELSALEAADHAIGTIEQLDQHIGAVVTPLFAAARQRATQLDALRQSGQVLGPLHGLPILVKDLFDPLAGVRNTFGCVAMRDHIATHTAVHLQRLIDAGANIIGKTNTPEFGHKGITDNHLFGPTSCPYDLSRNAGGSSGGSAAAVAAGMVSLAQGSDAGGSIRVPAAWCGVVGFKPSFGRVPNSGGPDAFGTHTPFVHAGPLTATVRDAALAASVMMGPDDDDPLSLPHDGVDLLQAATTTNDAFRVGYSPTFSGFAVDREVQNVVSRAVVRMAADGCQIELSSLWFSLSQDDMAQLWRRQVGRVYAAMFAGMAPPGGDFLVDHRDAIPAAIHDLVDAARHHTALDASRDQQLRTIVYRELQAELRKFDLLITPTVGAVAVPNQPGGETLGPCEVDGVPTDPLIGWCLTHPLNFTGHPAISVPAGLTAGGLPVGLQIIGRRHRDDQVIALAARFERCCDWSASLSNMRAQLPRG
jgi:amidase/aspartyl-tRNA(Asn)/glutamyl-tRNA(Gln) amidotransferase subunit A